MNFIDEKVCYVDCVWDRCKNLQKINSIEIYYTVKNHNSETYCCIDYTFYIVDYKIFKQIIEHNITFVKKYILLKNDEVISKLDDENNVEIDLYNKYSIISKDIRLLYNMYFIPFIENKDHLKNMNNSLMINTWTGNPL